MRNLIFTTSPSLRAKYPQAQHRGKFYGEMERADVIYTDMPTVRDAYKKVGVDVEWLGKKVVKKRVKKNVGLRNDSSK